MFFFFFCFVFLFVFGGFVFFAFGFGGQLFSHLCAGGIWNLGRSSISGLRSFIGL